MKDVLKYYDLNNTLLKSDRKFIKITHILTLLNKP